VPGHWEACTSAALARLRPCRTVAGHFPRDHRHAPAQSRRDLPHRLTLSQLERDLLPLTERQPAEPAKLAVNGAVAKRGIARR
jgi:hypothetical protein